MENLSYLITVEVPAKGEMRSLVEAIQEGYDNGAAGQFEVIVTTQPTYMVVFLRRTDESDMDYIRQRAKANNVSLHLAAALQLAAELQGGVGSMAEAVVDVLLAGDHQVIDFNRVLTDESAVTPEENAGLANLVEAGSRLSEASQVTVEHWASPLYKGDAVYSVKTPFTMGFIDRRQSSGQAMLALANDESHIDDILSIALEVSNVPGVNDPVQALSLFFNDDAVALRFYKQGDNYLVAPGSAEVKMQPTVLPCGTDGWLLS